MPATRFPQENTSTHMHAPTDLHQEHHAGDPALPTLLCVHGLGGHVRHWDQVVAAVDGRAPMTTVDLPGFGASPALGGRISLDDLADAVASAAPSRFVVVGHSLGGPLALRLAVRSPQGCMGVVALCGTIPSFQQTLARRVRPWRQRPATAWATTAEVGSTVLPVPRPVRGLLARHPWLRQATLWPFVAAPRELDPAFARILLDGAGAPGLLATAGAVARAPDVRTLPRPAVPVLAINGTLDRIAPPADLELCRHQIDDAVLLEGCGHVPMLEQPQALAERLVDFAKNTVDAR
jgi:pimeloyl-ACP methyl ester carboxylesterase